MSEWHKFNAELFDESRFLITRTKCVPSESFLPRDFFPVFNVGNVKKEDKVAAFVDYFKGGEYNILLCRG